jgi:hypothetical protein
LAKRFRDPKTGEHIPYRDGKNLAAREKMALASTYAGMAFTRANVGYVHAIAHQFGGKKAAGAISDLIFREKVHALRQALTHQLFQSIEIMPLLGGNRHDLGIG